ncbi:MAG: ABC transporter permease [Acidobacteria bacterium]|nr:ABC transporter permease [Acidobacteriota bacterium]
MIRALSLVTRRQWDRHRLRTGLTMLGIALGVSVIFAVRTANITLLGSLRQTIEKLAGTATLQVIGGESGFPEEVLDLVRSTIGVQIAEPVIEVVAHTAFSDEASLMVIGVDTTGDQELREYQFDESRSEIGDPLVYVAQPDSILISRPFADKHGLKEEDRLPLFTSHGRKEFTIRGIFKPVGIGEVFGGQVAVMDVYSAQFVFDRGRNFDRIDLMTDPEVPIETVERRLRDQLPAGLEVTRPASRGEGIENTVAAMRQGLIITSFIALLVGLFIIFNAFSISVNQRWKEIGVLRALGVEAPNIQRMFLGEAAVIGMLGSLIGVAGGFYIAVGATEVVSGIASAVYGYASTPEPPIFRLDYALEAFAAGTLTSLVAAWLPARAAARLNPALALHNIETRQPEAVLGRPRMLAGLGLILSGLAFIRFSTPRVGLMLQFGYVVLIVLGLIIVLPMLAQWIARALRPVMAWAFGPEGLLAIDTMIKAPRRTSATVGALMIGLMFVFSTGAYIQSYQNLVMRWMDRTINSDLFVTTSEQARSRTYHFSEALSQRIAALPGVKRVENVRFTFVPFAGDTAAVITIEMDGWFDRQHHPVEEGDDRLARELLPKGEGFVIARNFSTRWGTRVGDRLRLESPTGPLERPVIGIIEDYSSEKGSVFMDRELFKTYWRDSAIDFIDINLLPGVDRAAFKSELQRMLAGEQRAFIYTNDEYKRWVMSLIDQFFTLNYMQMVVAIFVAAIGIVNTLIISVSERRREIGVIRAIGGLRGQVRKMVLLEAVAIAIVGLVVGALAGALNTYFLIRTAAVILAGFTIPFHFPATLIIISMPIVVVIALAAAWLPARHAVDLHVAEAIGYE